MRKHGILREGRGGAGDESAESDFAGDNKTKMTWYQAAGISGISGRHMRQLRERYEGGRVS